MTDASAIEVLERTAGYLRLRLPLALRHPAAGATIEKSLAALPGVQRVTLLTAEGRLAVRFDPRVASHAVIAVRLKSLLAELPQAETPAASSEAPAAASPAPSLVERVGEMRGKLILAAPERFRPLVESATTEKAVTNFFNDIVAFYLIKVHWDMIVKQWIKDPVKYGNAWLTVFYLVFLLIRYRKT